MMVCVMIEIFRKLNVRKTKMKQERSLIQSLLWAQVSQLTFIYLLRLPMFNHMAYCVILWSNVPYNKLSFC